MLYKTKDNDRLDTICQDFYNNVNLLTLVLDKNPALADYPPLLPAGIVINLPDVNPVKNEAPTIRLWD